MANRFLHSGLRLIEIAEIPGVGVLFACWGPFRNRSKGRPRCPSSWCDMRDTLSKLACPECGCDAKREHL